MSTATDRTVHGRPQSPFIGCGLPNLATPPGDVPRALHPNGNPNRRWNPVARHRWWRRSLGRALPQFRKQRAVACMASDRPRWYRGLPNNPISYRPASSGGLPMQSISRAAGAVPAWLVALCLLSAASLPARAQAPAPSGQEARDAELAAAEAAGVKAGTRGPASIKLIDQAALDLPAGYMFIPKAEGVRILRALGNTVNGDAHQGLVVSLDANASWIVVVRYIKDGNDEANKNRAERGFPEVQIIGWVEKPIYDSATRRLVWSLQSKLKGESDSQPTGINYNTYALGRDGYFSLNLLTSSDVVATEKSVAHKLLAGLTYNDGKRYEDFNPSTDHIAAYGIAALVGGIAAKKLGLLALIGAFALKFAKLIVVGVAAVGAGIWKMLGGKRENV